MLSLIAWLIVGLIAGALARLPGLDASALRAEWERLHRRPPPGDISMRQLTPALC